MAFAKHSIRKRRAADIEYGKVTAEAARRFRPDVILSSNMPPDGQKILLKEARYQDARFIYWLQDIYGLAVRFVLARRLKMLANLGGAYYEAFEKRLLQQSDYVVCISDAFVEYLRNWKIPEDKIHLIENWSPLDEITPICQRTTPGRWKTA